MPLSASGCCLHSSHPAIHTLPFNLTVAVLIAAATRHGARGIGYELDKELAAAAVSNVKRERVEHLVKIIRFVARIETMGLPLPDLSLGSV